MKTALPRSLVILALLVASLVQVPTVAAALSDALSAGDASVVGIALEARERDGLTLGAEGMMPGDSVTSAVEVRNDGDVDLRYALAGSTGTDSQSLAAVLVLSIRGIDTGVGMAPADDGDPCDDAVGPVLRRADVLAQDASLLGNRALGSDGGDRTLAPGVSEVLCLVVELPLTVGNEYQAASAEVSITFVAEETGNNP